MSAGLSEQTVLLAILLSRIAGGDSKHWFSHYVGAATPSAIQVKDLGGILNTALTPAQLIYNVTSYIWYAPNPTMTIRALCQVALLEAGSVAVDKYGNSDVNMMYGLMHRQVASEWGRQAKVFRMLSQDCLKSGLTRPTFAEYQDSSLGLYDYNTLPPSRPSLARRNSQKEMGEHQRKILKKLETRRRQLRMQARTEQNHQDFTSKGISFVAPGNNIKLFSVRKPYIIQPQKSYSSLSISHNNYISNVRMSGIILVGTLILYKIKNFKENRKPAMVQIIYIN